MLSRCEYMIWETAASCRTACVFALNPDCEVVCCGEGWKPCVSDCHDELALKYPGYKFEP